jgi:Protein of unknown function (DUF3570)
MQLASPSAHAPPRLLLAACLHFAIASAPAAAQLETTAGASIFSEDGGPLSMTVIVPEVAADVQITSGFAVNAGWTADIVSGASVAVVDQPALTVDAISTASVSDVRHVVGGGVTLSDGQNTLAANYRYGFENDYRSHAFDVSARTELYDRNTAFEITYARSFDEICDVPEASEPALQPRMPNSDGCFDDADEDRVTRDLALHTFQAAWTQNWTAILSTQLTATALLLDGFQANPYRAVRIGRTAAQEYHPENRARYAVGLAGRLWIAPLSGAVQPALRVYRDTWDIRSLSAELAYEQTLFAGLRLRARGRYYTQNGAAFYSDDYVLAPVGSYFTGDRELSPMSSWLVGGQLSFNPESDDQGEVLGFLSSLQLLVKGDLLKSSFPHFHYDRAPVPNDLALVGSVGIIASF